MFYDFKKLKMLKCLAGSNALNILFKGYCKHSVSLVCPVHLFYLACDCAIFMKK